MNTCTVCDSTKLRNFQAKEWMFQVGKEFNYEFCRDCGCIQLASVLKNPFELYPKNYHSFAKNLERFYSSALGTKKLNRIKQCFLRSSGPIEDPPVLTMLRDWRIPKTARIADIGCGQGELLYIMRELGFSNTVGFDPFLEQSIRYSNGLQIAKLRIEAIREKFDLIMLNHSFEHMEKPIGVLNQLRKLMDGPNSRLLLRIPVVNQAWIDFGEYWYQIDPPRHLHLFSPAGMSLLLKKSNLELERTVYDSTTAQILLSEKNFWRFNSRSLSYYMKRIVRPIRTFWLQKKVNLWNQFGLGDQAAFLIKKAESANVKNEK